MSSMLNVIRLLHNRRSLSLISLRWVPALIMAVLFTAALVACGGDSGGSTGQPADEGGPADTAPTATASAVDTPTPSVQTQEGAELTTEEYAEAMEEIVATQEEAIEIAGAAFFSDPPFSREEGERFYALETSDSWSQEDMEFASDVAETILQAWVTDLFGAFLEITRDSIDEMSRLAPPEHLSDLHGDFITTSREVLQLVQESLEAVQGTDTNIGDRDELADFSEAVDSLESGPSDPELEERAEAACLELEGRLETELERGVSICGS